MRLRNTGFATTSFLLLMSACGSGSLSFGSKGVKAKGEVDVPDSLRNPGRASFATAADASASADLPAIDSLRTAGYRVSPQFHEDGAVRFAFVPLTGEGQGIIDASVHVSFEIRSNVPFPIEGAARVVEAHPPKEGEHLQLVIDIDGSGSMTSADRSRQRVVAATRFAEMLSEHDPMHELAVFEFASQVHHRAPLSSDLPTIRAAIDAVGASGGTRLNDSLSESIDYLVAQRKPGYRLAILLLTDGVDTASDATRSEVIRKARQHDVTIFAISLGGALDVSGLGFVGPVQVYAAETGGIFAHVDRAEGLVEEFVTMALAHTTGWVEVEANLRGLGGVFIPFSKMTIEAKVSAGDREAAAPSFDFIVPLNLGTDAQ